MPATMQKTIGSFLYALESGDEVFVTLTDAAQESRGRLPHQPFQAVAKRRSPATGEHEQVERIVLTRGERDRLLSTATLEIRRDGAFFQYLHVR